MVPPYHAMNGEKTAYTGVIPVILGPTAAGKTAAATVLCRRVGGEIVSCDAMQVYRGLDVGTAKSPARERAALRQHLLDIVEPAAPFSAAAYREAADKVIEDLCGRGIVPVVCGGSGLYLQGLLTPHTYGDAPRDEAVRNRYTALLEARGKDALYAALQRVDPDTAMRLHPNDTKRIIRALEVFEGRGAPKSALMTARSLPPRYAAYLVGLDPPRPLLYERIDKRVDDMLAAGLEAEVRALLQAGVPRGAQAMCAIGYKETAAYLDGDLPRAEWIELIKKNTRRYAKRQMTFFRHQFEDVHWCRDGKELATALDAVVQLIKDKH